MLLFTIYAVEKLDHEIFRLVDLNEVAMLKLFSILLFFSLAVMVIYDDQRAFKHLFNGNLGI